MELLPEIARRRSVRRFHPEPVSRDILDRIVAAGWRAPSAKNRQAWRFIVVTEGVTRQKLQDAAFGQDYVGDAAAVIALCTTNVEYRMPNGQHSHPVDIGIAAAFMMIQAEHEGLGTCPITTYDEQEAKQILSVPHRMQVIMLLLVGKPAEEPELTERLPADRVIVYEHW